MARTNGTGNASAARHPSALLDQLNTGSGIIEYLEVNRDFQRRFAGYYGEAGDFLRKELAHVPLAGVRDWRSRDADTKKLASQIGRRLRLAEQSQMASARFIQTAAGLYIRNWGDPASRKRPMPKGINPDA